MMFEQVPPHITLVATVLVAGLFATASMVTFLAGCQQLGLSRINLPFLIGTMFTERRARAIAVGFLVFFTGGWAFGFLYALALDLIGSHAWWVGALLVQPAGSPDSGFESAM